MTRLFFIFSTFAFAAASIACPTHKRYFTGSATLGAQGVGACGFLTTDEQFVTGVNAAYFDSYPGYEGGNPNKNPLCGRFIQAIYNGTTVQVKVTDRFTEGNMYDLMLSKAAFAKLTVQLGGSIPVNWTQH